MLVFPHKEESSYEPAAQDSEGWSCSSYDRRSLRPRGVRLLQDRTAR